MFELPQTGKAESISGAFSPRNKGHMKIKGDLTPMRWRNPCWTVQHTWRSKCMYQELGFPVLVVYMYVPQDYAQVDDLPHEATICLPWWGL
jgi:hypothetical protein